MSKPKSKIFANGSTTLPKPVREALGVEAGDTVCYIISEDRVQILKVPSDGNSAKVDVDDPTLREALDTAEVVMDENHALLRKLK